MIWSGRWEGGSGLGTHVHPWLIHVNVWQNEYSIVKKNKVKIKILKIKNKKMRSYIDYQFVLYFLFLRKEKCNWHNEVYWVFFLGMPCFSIWSKNGDIDTEQGFHSYQC